MKNDTKCHPEGAKRPKDLIKIIIFLIVLVAGGIIWFFGITNVILSEAKRSEESPTRESLKGFTRGVTLKINLGDAKISYKTKIEKPILVFDLLQKAAKEKKFVLKYKNYSGMGAFITKIGDKENGMNRKFWRYFVNGKYAQVGASSYLLKGGEIVEWAFK